MLIWSFVVFLEDVSLFVSVRRFPKRIEDKKSRFIFVVKLCWSPEMPSSMCSVIQICEEFSSVRMSFHSVFPDGSAKTTTTDGQYSKSVSVNEGGSKFYQNGSCILVLFSPRRGQEDKDHEHEQALQHRWHCG